MSIKRPLAPTSATEIALFRKCRRAWAAAYCSDAWPVSKDQRHFALGTAYHTAVETYLRTGALPPDPSDPVTEMLMCALPHLPAPGDFEALEVRDSVEIEGGVPATVTADYVGRTAEGAVHILDHKTSKDPHRYGLRTKEAKLSDTQTVLYSHTYLRGTAGVWFDHLYIKKHKAAYAKYESHKPIPKGVPDSPQPLPTPIFLSAEELQDAYQTTVAEPAQQLYQIRHKGMPIDPASQPGPATLQTCMEYGGCPHLAMCHPNGIAFLADSAPVPPITAPAPAPAADPRPARALTLREWLVATGRIKV